MSSSVGASAGNDNRGSCRLPQENAPSLTLMYIIERIFFGKSGNNGSHKSSDDDATKRDEMGRNTPSPNQPSLQVKLCVW